MVFDDLGTKNIADSSIQEDNGNEGRTVGRCCIQLARILQYLECPQYLRKYFFPIHRDLQYAGLLNPLDAPHHLRQNDEFAFRYGLWAYIYLTLLKCVIMMCIMFENEFACVTSY